MTENIEFSGSDIFPNETFVNDKKNISIGGIDLEELADTYGTPLYVYDENTIVETIKDFQKSFKAELEDSVISYSTKAFSNPYILNLLNENKMNIDVVTGGELAVAKHVKFPPERINFHGNNKSKEEHKVYRLVSKYLQDEYSDKILYFKEVLKDIGIKDVRTQKEKQDEHWNNQYSKLLKYLEDKTKLVAYNIEDKSLKNWIGTQKKDYKKYKLSKEYIDKLDKVQLWKW